MTSYAELEHHADLGGIEAFPDRTGEERSDDPTNENSPGRLHPSEASVRTTHSNGLRN